MVLAKLAHTFKNNMHSGIACSAGGLMSVASDANLACKRVKTVLTDFTPSIFVTVDPHFFAFQVSV